MPRPEILFPLFADVETLPGVGKKTAALLEKTAGGRVLDLLLTPPAGVIDRRFQPGAANAPAGRIATFTLQVVEHAPPNSPRRPYRVVAEDGTGQIELIFFHAKGDWLAKLLPIGQTRVVSGKVERFGERPQIAHPDHVEPPENAAAVLRVEPVYPLTAGLSQRLAGKAAAAALERAPDLPEWLDPAWRDKQGWTGWRAAMAAVHAPEDVSDLSLLAPARARAAYDELLATQLALAIIRARRRRARGRAIAGDGRLRAQALSALPFAPTGAQTRAGAEIAADMAAETRMLRLLQGDVGSGKTLVALMAMLNAVEAGAQAALMAPTEILARQHHAALEPLCAQIGIKAVLLTGRDRGKARAAKLEALATGSAAIAIGTHALLTDDVVFADLGLAVIDEQHRFGVHQRLMLSARGADDGGPAADVLVMTATPIPRTLLLTGYGDVDVSKLDEKPPGRKPIVTRAIPAERIDEVVAGVGRAIGRGEKVYWICPLVEESIGDDGAAAEARHAALAECFPGRVGLAHGRLKPAAKDAAMAAFSGRSADGKTPETLSDILVATTVVEVGVDVPEASVIVIEGAQRFGLAQLHQLRGRVGRGDRESACLLLYDGPLGETAEARLKIMRETEDGFRIAEEDLRLRGGGDVLGLKQSGLPRFRLADVAVHGELLAAARDDARLIVNRDPKLESERGQALRALLHLFERADAVRTLESG